MSASTRGAECYRTVRGRRCRGRRPNRDRRADRVVVFHQPSQVAERVLEHLRHTDLGRRSRARHPGESARATASSTRFSLSVTGGRTATMYVSTSRPWSSRHDVECTSGAPTRSVAPRRRRCRPVADRGASPVGGSPRGSGGGDAPRLPRDRRTAPRATARPALSTTRRSSARAPSFDDRRWLELRRHRARVRDGAGEDPSRVFRTPWSSPRVSGELFHDLVVGAAATQPPETRDFLQHRCLRPRGQPEGSTLKMTRRGHPSRSLAKWPIDGSAGGVERRCLRA